MTTRSDLKITALGHAVKMAELALEASLDTDSPQVLDADHVVEDATKFLTFLEGKGGDQGS